MTERAESGDGDAPFVQRGEAGSIPCSALNKVYTAGYQSLSTQRVLVEAVRGLDAVLVDVRLSARSKDPQWEGKSLQSVLGERYLAVSEFGNVNFKGGGPIQLKNPARGMARVSPLIARGPIILLCACYSPSFCHRSQAGWYLAEHMGVQVTHLTAADLKGFSEPVPAKPRAGDSQLSIF